MGIGIPTIKLDICAEKGSEVGELNGNALGLGLTIVWLFGVLYGSTALLGPESGRAFLWAFGGTAAAVAFVGAAFDKRFHGLFARFSPVVPISISCCVAALTLLGASHLGALAPVLAAVAGVALGLGAVLLVFYWGIAFSRTETSTIVFNACASTTLAVLAYALVIEKLPYPCDHLIVALLPLANIVLLRHRVTENLPNPDMREAAYFSELNIARGGFAVKVVPALLCLGLVLALLLEHAGYCLTPNAGTLGVVYTVLALALSCLIVAASAIRVISQDQTFAHTLRTLLPLVALFILPLPFTEVAEASIGNMLILAAIAMVITLAWSYLGNVSQGFRLSPVYVFGLGSGAVTVGMGLAAAVDTWAPALASGVMSQAALGLVLCLFGLIVACGLFPRQDDIRALVERSFALPKLEDSVAWSGDEGLRTAGTDRLDRTAPERTEETDGETEERRKGRFMRRCDQVADTYLLSRRETDVLYLLAKGRNVSYIKDKLYISEGTAKTHVHHVYKKLNVHSQQELIALIDSIQTE